MPHEGYADPGMHGTRLTPAESNGAQGLKPPDLKSRVQLIRVRRLAHGGPKATSHRTEPGEKT